jgi:hypothetical protein
MGNNPKAAPKFVKGIWITGNLKLNNEFLIGRTYIRKGCNVVSVVTTSGALIEIPFENVQNIKQLNILSRTAPTITSSLYNKTNITIDEKIIIEVLDTINNKN